MKESGAASGDNDDKTINLRSGNHDMTVSKI